MALNSCAENMRHRLGPVSALSAGSSKAYTLNINDKLLNLFVVHYHGKFYAYENHCPHTGIELNWQPDQFLDITGQRIQCATHGALFRINDGLCEWGPCLGQRLRPLTIDVQNDELILIHHNADLA